MAAIAFLAFWIVLGIGVFLVAMSNGRGAPGTRPSETLATRRGIAVLIGSFCVLVGGVLPAVVIAKNTNQSKAGYQGVKLTAAERHGRELFGRTCNECHTLAAANTAGKVGPNFDQLRPPKSLVLDAIINGRAQGNGRMPAGLLSGPDAEDVAAFVAKVSGRN